jgi:hypothetical protein
MASQENQKYDKLLRLIRKLEREINNGKSQTSLTEEIINEQSQQQLPILDKKDVKEKLKNNGDYYFFINNSNKFCIATRINNTFYIKEIKLIAEDTY